LAMLGFELRASHLLGRHCYVLSYSVSSFLWWVLVLKNYLSWAGFKPQSNQSLSE
jgi:hypothetical protein